MYIGVPAIALKELVDKYEMFDSYIKRWSNDYEEVWIQWNILDSAQLSALENWLNDNIERHESVKSLNRKWQSFKQAKDNSDNLKIKSLQKIPALVHGFATKHLPTQTLFKDEDGELLAYTLLSAEYIAANQYSPASAEITLGYSLHNDIKTTQITIESSIFAKNKTIADVIYDNGYIIETPEILAEYAASVDKFADLHNKIGDVYVAKNIGALAGNRSWYSSTKYNFRKDVVNKVVLDVNGYYELNAVSKSKSSKTGTKSEFTEDGSTQVHIHPFCYVFHLEEHKWLSVHVNNLDPYQFKDASYLDKLILPEDTKDLVNILMTTTKIQLEDIVAGKSGGSFILATGLPGTGKTLTAEMLAEIIQKPLYKVQCSQLGIVVDEIEKKLTNVLRNASRWGALLLVDEADVYIRKRDTDINQNAIVGVFLRTLEYYNGIMFMTSNMAQSIDDAILSRATAHVEYSKPSKDEQRKIWNILAEQFNVKLTSELVETLLTEMPDVVGRDIKALLKLAIMYAEDKQLDLTFDVFEKISKFIATTNIKKTK